MFTSQNVKELVSSSPTASAVFHAFAQRQRGRNVINLDLMKVNLMISGVKFIDADFMETFKALESLEVGHIIHGRKGNPTYFVWKFDLKDVVKMASGDTTVNPRPVTLREPRSERKKHLKLHAKVARKARLGRPPGRPKGSANKTTKAKYAYIRIPIEFLKSLK